MRFFFCIFVLCLSSIFALTHQRHFSRLYVFGDSYSDIGEGYLDGNGPTAVAYLADHLGFKLFPSNATALQQRSLDFAVSGAQTGEGKGDRHLGVLLGYGMRNQVADFAALVRSGKIKFPKERTLFFLAGGLNDGKLPSETTVENLEAEIKTLHALGGRHFAVALMPTAIPAFSAVGTRLNPALETIPQQLAGQLKGADVVLSDWGPFFDEVMKAPEQYGIRNAKDACAGRAIFHQDAKECTTPDDHFYYHSGHPSTAVHKIVGQKLYEELVR